VERPEKFRPILIANLWYKIVETRFKPHLDDLVENLGLNQYQSGFIKDEGTQKNIFIATNNILDKQFVVSIDCADAYNSLNWKVIDEMLEDNMHGGLHKESRNFIKKLYKMQAVYQDGKLFKIGRGLAQGQILAPSLFILTLEAAIRFVERDTGIEIRKNFLNNVLCYADDILIFGSTR